MNKNTPSASGAMALTAAIDIGTNSILLLIVENVRGDQNKPHPPNQSPVLNVVADLAKTARLGEGLAQTGVLQEAAMERAIAILQDYAQLLDEHPVQTVLCFGTAAIRQAQNGSVFCDRVQQTLGWSVRILSGQEEAFYTFKGVMSSAQTDTSGSSAIAIDIGGGSTEVIAGSAEAITYEQSFPVGAVVLKDELAIPGQISPEQQKKILAHLQTQFAALPQAKGSTALVTGGTATTLAALALKLKTYDIEKIDGYQLTLEQVEVVFASLNEMTREVRAQIPGMEAGRADIILPALLILKGVCDRLQIEEITITVRGARYGILLD